MSTAGTTRWGLNCLLLISPRCCVCLATSAQHRVRLFQILVWRAHPHHSPKRGEAVFGGGRGSTSTPRAARTAGPGVASPRFFEGGRGPPRPLRFFPLG